MRIRVTDIAVEIGGHAFPRIKLDRWDFWTNAELVAAIRGLKPPLTTEELGVLQAVPRTMGGQNGLVELQQVLTQTTPIQLCEDDHVDDGE